MTGTEKSSPRKTPTREERLAAKLRENLRRRKAQAKALDGAGANAEDSTGDSDADDKTA